MTDRTAPQGVSRLKELLFDSEARRIEALQRQLSTLEREAERVREMEVRLDQAFERAGSPDRLQKSVASILDGALQDAEVRKHDEMSRALAPLVVSTVKTEMRNNQDEMVEVLYPITGKLVKQYVAAAMKDLMRDINARLAGGPGLKLRLKSWTSGTPVADLVLQQNQRLEVAELYLVRRGSGTLIAHWPPPNRADDKRGGNRDALVSGFLAAITSFAEEAFESKSDTLRKLDLDDKLVFLRGSPSYLLAAVCRGSGPEPLEAVIDEAFLDFMTRNTDLLTEPLQHGGKSLALDRLLPPLATNLDGRLAERHGELYPAVPPSMAPLYTLLTVLALPFVAWALWSMYLGIETNRTRNAAESVLAASRDLGGYNVAVAVDRGGRAVTLSGLMPGEGGRITLVDRMRAGTGSAVEIRDQLAVVSAARGPDPEPRLLAMERGTISRSLARASINLQDIDRDIAAMPPGEAQRRLAAIRPVASALDAEIGKIATTMPASRSGLDALGTEIAALIERGRQLAAAAGVGQPSAATTGGERLSAAEHLDDLLASVAARVRVLSAESRIDTVAADNRLLKARLDNLPGPAPAQVTVTPRARLEAFARANAIFFGNGVEFRDDAAAARTIEQLAALIREAPGLVRVVGYTDERGATQSNTALALNRAERVAAELAARGLGRDRIVAVGRSNAIDLSPVAGAQSNNRRVEFEVGFVGELPPGGAR
jgi:outer membrane protein OmpA-like peptidoglycan-associated protein